MGCKNGGIYLQRVLQTSRRQLSSPEEYEVPGTLQVMLFVYGLSFVELIARHKSVKAQHNKAAQAGTTTRVVNRMIVKAFRALCLA